MFTDPWGLDEGDRRSFEDHEGTELETGTVEVTAKVPEGTKKDAKDVIGAKYYHENTSTFDKMPYYKHDGQWVSSLEYDNKLTNLARGLDNPNYDPASDGFDFSEGMSDNFYALFADKLRHVYGTTDPYLKNTGIPNPVFAGHAINDAPDIFLCLLPMAKGTKVMGEAALIMLSRAAVKVGQSVATYFIERQIARFALRATQKGTSEAFVLLGKYSEGGIRYIDVAKKEGATFFSLDIYDQLFIKKGEEFMWAINKKFIKNQWDLGKTFIFSHNPKNATGAFLKEINYLKELGGNNIKFVPYGNLWRLIK